MSADQHAVLMDQVYRWQRHCYDLTRKYYLFGRDRTIDNLGPMPAGASVLEVGCGTGRNLRRCLQRYPRINGYGIDISAQMLATASRQLQRDGLAARVTLARGDASSFDSQILFGRAGFDRVLLPYCLSMMPDWQAALAQAMQVLAPGGALHVVDFGQQEKFPAWARQALRAWLTRFEVTPRADLVEAFSRTARANGLQMMAPDKLGGGYAILLKATRL